MNQVRRPLWDRWEVWVLGMLTFWLVLDGLKYGWLLP